MVETLLRKSCVQQAIVDVMSHNVQVKFKVNGLKTSYEIKAKGNNGRFNGLFSKYVSELSIVRDCATECAEKEIWETQTYCCTEDGCNGSTTIEASAVVVILPLVIYLVNEIMNIIKQQRR